MSYLGIASHGLKRQKQLYDLQVRGDPRQLHLRLQQSCHLSLVTVRATARTTLKDYAGLETNVGFPMYRILL
jgi:hypothetical protein